MLGSCLDPDRLIQREPNLNFLRKRCLKSVRFERVRSVQCTRCVDAKSSGSDNKGSQKLSRRPREPLVIAGAGARWANPEVVIQFGQRPGWSDNPSEEPLAPQDSRLNNA